MDPSGSKCQTDLNPVSSCFFLIVATLLPLHDQGVTVVLDLPVVCSVRLIDVFPPYLMFVSGILTAVVLPVAGVWTVGFFLIVLVTVAKAGSRRLAQMEKH